MNERKCEKCHRNNAAPGEPLCLSCQQAQDQAKELEAAKEADAIAKRLDEQCQMQ